MGQKLDIINKSINLETIKAASSGLILIRQNIKRPADKYSELEYRSLVRQNTHIIVDF